jgi:hypothetical protein
MAMTTPQEVSAERLARAVGEGTSWRGVLRALGLPPSSRRSRELRARCQELKIDHSHFIGSRRVTDAELRTTVPRAKGWGDLLHRLGYSPDNVAARQRIEAHLLRLGLNADHLGQQRASAQDGMHAHHLLMTNLREAGALVVAAILALEGRKVSWPLEPTHYDLIAESPTGLQRVQVKTTTRKAGGTWVCSLSRSTYAADSAGLRRRSWYSPDDVDVFGVVDGDLNVYMIPASLVAGLSAIHVRKYGSYRVARSLPRPV